jgi:hypothetical protein
MIATFARSETESRLVSEARHRVSFQAERHKVDFIRRFPATLSDVER